MKNLRRYSDLIWNLTKIYFFHSGNKDAEYRRTIFYKFREWGGVYIKFLQIMAGMSKFMEGWSGPKEMQVFSKAPYEDVELRKYVDLSKFKAISAKPVAAGSFALVFYGKLHDDTEVAIKVLRPSIRNHLKKDLGTLRKLCRFFSRFLPNYLVDYREAYDACAKMFLQETDYRQEIANQTYFGKLYENHPRVVIPKVYTELSSNYVIVQDFITGPTLADVMSNTSYRKSAATLTRELTGSDLWEQIALAGGEALRMAMCADYVYGDPHPGNIVLLPNNKIAFIDFGVIAEKPTSHMAFYEWVNSYYEILCEKGDFKKLLETTVTCFCPDLSLAMKRCVFDGDDLLTVLSAAITKKLSTEMAGDANYIQIFKDGHLMQVFAKVVSTKVIEVKVDAINFKLLKAMQAFLGSVTILDNSEGHHGFAETMRQAMEYAIAEAKAQGIPHDIVSTSRYSLTESYELVVNTISSLADNDEFIFNIIKEKIFA